MDATIPNNLEIRPQRVQRLLNVRLCRGLVLIGAIGLGLFFMVGLALALDNHRVFHATGEQINPGISVKGSYTDTFTADGTYRILERHPNHRVEWLRHQSGCGHV